MRYQRPGARRRGFTLPEVLLAVLLLAIGMTALASTGAALARIAGQARALSAASLLAGSVLDSLRASPCRGLAGGSLAIAPATMRWTARPDTLVVYVAATVEVRIGVGLRAWAIETLVPCDG